MYWYANDSMYRRMEAPKPTSLRIVSSIEWAPKWMKHRGMSYRTFHYVKSSHNDIIHTARQYLKTANGADARVHGLHTRALTKIFVVDVWGHRLARLLFTFVCMRMRSIYNALRGMRGIIVKNFASQLQANRFRCVLLIRWMRAHIKDQNSERSTSEI